MQIGKAEEILYLVDCWHFIFSLKVSGDNT